MTQVLKTVADVRAFRRHYADKTLGFVPTMGNLHEGHLSLMQIAQRHSEKVIASVFVNPTQFAENEDLHNYPRTFDADLEKLQSIGVDAVFFPDEKSIYPMGRHRTLSIEMPTEITHILCGLARPTHFQGVATVVTKLLQIVQPQVAVFGKKDYQQLTIIRRLVTELFMEVEIVGGEIIRETNGLAMSSRNQYLTDAEREQAAMLFKVLQFVRQQLLSGDKREMIINQAKHDLERAGIAVEYLDCRDKDTLQEEPILENAILLIAARIGSTRLIDNLRVV